jgi:large subunit ribosomal protein L6
MSRIGKKPIVLPAGVSVNVDGQVVTVKGGRGALSFTAPAEVEVRTEANQLTVSPRDAEDARSRAMWGMSRSILANNVKGVSEGFERALELVGVGYRAAMKGEAVELSLGYSHPVVYTPPKGVKIETVKPTELKLSGADRQVLGQVAAEIRSKRPPEPYKGKGVKYFGERIRRKEGKKK